MRLHGGLIYELSEWIIARTSGQTMSCFTRTMISSVDLASYKVCQAKHLGILGYWYKK